MLFFIEGEGSGGGASEGFVCSYYIYRVIILVLWCCWIGSIKGMHIVAFMRGVQVVVAGCGF